MQGFPEWRTNDDQLTYIFIEIVKKLPGVTYGDLLDILHETIDGVNNRGSVFSRFLRSMLEGKILQVIIFYSYILSHVNDLKMLNFSF